METGAIHNNNQIPPQSMQELAALRQQPLRLDAAIMSLQDAVYVVDAKERIVFCNASLAQLTMRPVEALLGRFATEFYVADAIPALLAYRQQALAGEAIFPYLATQLRRKDQTRVPVELSLTPLSLGEEFVGCIAVVRDITAHKRIVQELRRVEHLSLLGKLASSVAHEICNPLNAISLHVDLLEEELRQPSSDDQAHMIGLPQIRDEITSLRDIVHDYLSLARLATLECTHEDLGAFLEDFAAEIQAHVASRGVSFHLKGLVDLGQVAFHPSTLRRALLNLVQNALHAMDDGGTLTLSGQRTASHIFIAVGDTGRGIPADQVPLIFAPLYTTKPEGTGLGLYIVQEIVTAHGGTITVQSVSGHGTTFIIMLPCPDAEEKPSSL